MLRVAPCPLPGDRGNELCEEFGDGGKALCRGLGDEGKVLCRGRGEVGKPFAPGRGEGGNGDVACGCGDAYGELGGGGRGLPGVEGKYAPTGVPAFENVALSGVPAYELYGLPVLALVRARRSPPPQRFFTPVASAATMPGVMSGPVMASPTLAPTLRVQPVQTHTPPITPTHLIRS